MIPAFLVPETPGDHGVGLIHDHAQGTEGRASPNPCFVLHASIVCFFRLHGFGDWKVIPWELRVPFMYSYIPWLKTGKYVHDMVLAIFYVKTNLCIIKMV